MRLGLNALSNLIVWSLRVPARVKRRREVRRGEIYLARQRDLVEERRGMIAEADRFSTQKDSRRLSGVLLDLWAIDRSRSTFRPVHVVRPRDDDDDDDWAHQ